MDEVRLLLIAPLDVADMKHLREQLSSRASCQPQISRLLRAAETDLAKVEDKYLLPTEGVGGVKYSEAERRIRLASAVAPERRKVDELADIARILSEHIELGKTLLNKS